MLASTFTLTQPTPARPARPADVPGPSARLPRLLYRGALSLPDSDMLLDGLTFSSADPYLLDNPIALALESMRGRPSLRFLGTAKLCDLWIDASGGVALDVHPQALLSRVYFENTFCLTQIATADRRSEIGVRVALGDSGQTDPFNIQPTRTNPQAGPDTTEMIIYASPAPIRPSEPLPPHIPPPVELRVARITTAPPPRIPRPDDPTPRKPPLIMLGSAKKRSASFAASRTLSRTASQIEFGGPSKKRKLELAAGGGSSNILDPAQRERSIPAPTVFKVPVVPTRKGKERAVIDVDMEELDVFGKPKVVKMAPLFNVKPKTTAPLKPRTKPKTTETQPPDPEIVLLDVKEGEMEKANKALIKKTTMRCLSMRGIGKLHAEFKELYNYINRGAAFALRTSIKSAELPPEVMDRLVEAHARLYIEDTNGGDTDPASSPITETRTMPPMKMAEEDLQARTRVLMLSSSSPMRHGTRDPLTSPVRESTVTEEDDVFG